MEIVGRKRPGEREERWGRKRRQGGEIEGEAKRRGRGEEK